MGHPHVARRAEVLIEVQRRTGARQVLELTRGHRFLNPAFRDPPERHSRIVARDARLGSVTLTAAQQKPEAERGTPPSGPKEARLTMHDVDQKSIVTLNLANRAEVIDNGFRYVAVGLRSVGEYAVW